VSLRHNSPRILQRFARASDDDCGEEHRPSHGEDRAVLVAVKVLAALDHAGYGLDGASAQLEVALM
jgi:hypothetical protein